MMESEIAFIAWGSLCWDPRDLPYGGEWFAGGPALPLEFSRISSDGRLTLVIDTQGSECATRFGWSTVNTLAGSVQALQAREGTPEKWIGFHDAMGGGSSVWKYPDQIDVDDRVASWMDSERHDASAAVWTALLPNFADKTGVPFSVEAGLRHIKSLTQERQMRALDYIRKAPEEIDTPFRKAAALEWSL